MNKFFNKYWKYIVVVLSIVLVAGLGTLFVNLGTAWFGTLVKPSNFIPDIVIPIVWSVIYLSFAIILCLWVKKKNLTTKTLFLLIINGIFNILWCLLFFTLNNTLLGLIAIIFNLILAWILILNINKQEKLYSYILSIYPIWLCLATCLNLATWILN